MTYNEWCEYAQFGQTCEYDFEINQFVERYNNAKHQQFLNQIENDRANKSVQGVANFWQERGQFLSADRNGSDSSIKLHTRPNYQEIHPAMQGWSSNVMG
jgi:hypothetical protein